MSVRGAPTSTDGPVRAPTPLFHRTAHPTAGREPADPPDEAAPPSRAAGEDVVYRPLRLTARGAVSLIVLATLLTTLISVWLGAPLISGLGFACTAVFTTLFIRRRDLLTLSVTPPAAYLGGALLALTLLALFGDGGGVSGVLLSLAMLLAGAAPWLFFGTAAVLIIGVFRGLGENIARFRRELQGHEEN